MEQLQECIFPILGILAYAAIGGLIGGAVGAGVGYLIDEFTLSSKIKEASSRATHFKITKNMVNNAPTVKTGHNFWTDGETVTMYNDYGCEEGQIHFDKDEIDNSIPRNQLLALCA